MSDVEILVRFDDDDGPSIARTAELQYMGVRVLVGPRYNGWNSHGTFYTELAMQARGKWVAMFNDDTEIHGKGWDRQLCGLPTTGMFVQPEIHKLNDSVYPRDEAGPVPFVPNGCWRDYGIPEVPCPTDTGLHDLLVRQHKWKVHFLEGITLWHDRHK